LTIGFGDITPISSAARGFLFVYEFIGIIFLGLVISSITRFVSNISADKIIKNHQARAREHTIGRTVTNEIELRERLGLPRRRKSSTTADNLAEYGNIKIQGRMVTFKEHRPVIKGSGRGGAGNMIPLSRDAKMKARAQGDTKTRRLHERRQKLLLLKEEKDRFHAMREIQEETRRFKRYWSLSVSIFAFALMWLLGALVFMLAEARMQGLTYFDSLYFCFAALLTIGYAPSIPSLSSRISFACFPTA
jgi:potassium channel subfamily K